MKKKKAYVSPEIRSEAINVGVFGDYCNGNKPACLANGSVPFGCTS